MYSHGDVAAFVTKGYVKPLGKIDDPMSLCVNSQVIEKGWAQSLQDKAAGDQTLAVGDPMAHWDTE